jgi:hypothetical protein
MKEFNKESWNAKSFVADILGLKIARFLTCSLLPTQLRFLSQKSDFLDSFFPDLNLHTSMAQRTVYLQ